MKLTGEEKGALLLRNLAPEVVESVLARLGPERSKQVRALMERVQIGPDSQAQLQELLRELREAMQDKTSEQDRKPLGAAAATASASKDTLTAKETPASKDVPAGGAAPSTPDTQAPPPVSRPAAKPLPAALPTTGDPLQDLALIPGERLALVLEGENVRTVCLILNFLDDERAGDLFRRLPSEVRNEVSVHFSTQAMPNVEVLKRVAQALLLKNQRLTEKPAFPDGTARLRKMADMLRLLPKADRLQAIAALEAKQPELATDVKNFLYRFEDVRRIDNRSMQKLLMDVDAKDLATALRDAPADIADKFMSNLSKRAQENLNEEMQISRPMSKEVIDQARQAIVNVIQRLDLAGELVMAE